MFKVRGGGAYRFDGRMVHGRKIVVEAAQMSSPKYTGEATERWYQMPETVRNMNSLLDTPYTVSKCPCVTGAEALYADMGHSDATPIGIEPGPNRRP